MARTDAQNCELLCETYDALLDSFAASPTGPIEITIRGRTVRYDNPADTLEKLEDLIRRCKARADAASGTGNKSRNRIRLRRDYC